MALHGATWRYMAMPEIRDSARRHQIADDDILHAYRHTFRVLTLEQERGTLVMYLGFARNGVTPLEVGIPDRAPPEIVHAMELRKDYEKYLPKGS